MSWIRPEKRAALYERASERCAYCDAQVLPGAHTSISAAATLDHVRPRNSGGSNSARNLVCCCARCNSQRQDTPLAVWARRVAAARAEGTVATDTEHRDEVVAEMASQLERSIINRVRAETRRHYHVTAKAVEEGEAA